MTGELRDAATGRVLVRRLVAASGLFARTIGYLGRRKIDADEALWFPDCHAVHTLGMRIPIDVVFLDAGGVVVAIVEAAPWNPWIASRGARSAVELQNGNAERCGIAPGMRLELKWDSPTSSS